MFLLAWQGFRTLGLLLGTQVPSGFTPPHTLSLGRPAEVGMSASILAAAVARYQQAIETGRLVGAVLLVARDGKVVLYEALGWRDKARRLRMQKSTMFRLASNTKPVIATAVSILVERGQLSYDDLVREYVPGFANELAGSIRVHHLLTHTSGLRIGPLFLPPAKDSAIGPSTLQGEVARFGEVGAKVPPGTSYSYSNAGFNTLGGLIEIRGGRPLAVFLRDEIYEPLGMLDSYNLETDETLDGKLGRMSVVYYEKKNGAWIPGWSPGDPPEVPFVRASGGMISTAWDYAIFLQLYLNGGIYGGKRILTKESIDRGTAPWTRRDLGEPRISADGDAHGYGWAVSPDGVFWHSGTDGTMAWVDPSRRLIGLAFTQTPLWRNPFREFRAAVNRSIEATPGSW